MVKRIALCYKGGKYEDFVGLARNVFEEIHYNEIK